MNIKMKNILKEILSTSLYLLVVLCITYLIIHYVGQRTQVLGSSMEGTLSNGDNLIVDKLSYRFREPERFDIVVFPVDTEEAAGKKKKGEDTYYIKRIIGLPGEIIQIDEEGIIYINGDVLEEDYGREVIRDPGIAGDPVTLGEGEYFVLGDNRNNSEDSRVPKVGCISRSRIIGRAWIRIWPLNKLGILKHQ